MSSKYLEIEDRVQDKTRAFWREELNLWMGR